MTYGGRWVTPSEVRSDMADPAKRYRIDPARYYFRTNPLFETGAESYEWLNDIVCIGSGYLIEGGITATNARADHAQEGTSAFLEKRAPAWRGC